MSRAYSRGFLTLKKTMGTRIPLLKRVLRTLMMRPFLLTLLPHRRLLTPLSPRKAPMLPAAFAMGVGTLHLQKTIVRMLFVVGSV